MKTRLPDLPSALVRIACGDLHAAMRDPRYRVSMNFWHRPDKLDEPDNNTCAVCLAGAVMAKTLEVPLDRTAAPVDFDFDTHKKLNALDYLRAGQVGNFLIRLSSKSLPLETLNELRRKYCPFDSMDPVRFTDWLELVERKLQEAGL